MPRSPARSLRVVSSIFSCTVTRGERVDPSWVTQTTVNCVLQKVGYILYNLVWYLAWINPYQKYLKLFVANYSMSVFFLFKTFPFLLQNVYARNIYNIQMYIFGFKSVFLLQFFALNLSFAVSSVDMKISTLSSR